YVQPVAHRHAHKNSAANGLSFFFFSPFLRGKKRRYSVMAAIATESPAPKNCRTTVAALMLTSKPPPVTNSPLAAVLTVAARSVTSTMLVSVWFILGVGSGWETYHFPLGHLEASREIFTCKLQPHSEQR